MLSGARAIHAIRGARSVRVRVQVPHGGLGVQVSGAATQQRVGLDLAAVVRDDCGRGGAGRDVSVKTK